MALPCGTTGSLWPGFPPARPVGLAVKPASAIALYAGFPFQLSRPLRASVTLWEATAPVKLPTSQCPAEAVRRPNRTGWYFNDASTEASAPVSQAPTYSTQLESNVTGKLQ